MEKHLGLEQEFPQLGVYKWLVRIHIPDPIPRGSEWAGLKWAQEVEIQ